MNKIKDRIQQLTSGMQMNHLIASAFAVALAIAFGLGLYAFRGAIFIDDSRQQVQEGQLGGESVFRHPLTGEKTSDGYLQLPRVFGVMIDHSVDAWPQAGVDRAFLVIEAPVEAGIPRLLAFFSEEMEVEKIGPVRSARPYFVRWNNELDALYAHVGGSNAALEFIRNSDGTLDLNQFYNGGAFWRSDDRLAPHNAFTSTALISSALSTLQEQEEVQAPEYGTWRFTDGQPRVAEGEEVDVTIDFSFPTYRVKWIYDRETNRYKRLQSGLPYTMEDGAAVHADNVAVVVTGMEVIDRIGRRKIETEGEGKSFVFHNGDIIKGTWKKPSVEDRLRFYDSGGDEIIMNAGTSWIEVVPSAEHVMFDAG